MSAEQAGDYALLRGRVREAVSRELLHNMRAHGFQCNAVTDAALEVLLTWRDERFGPGNDKVWGEGEWVRCADCLDAGGLPSYHHRAAHPGSNAQVQP